MPCEATRFLYYVRLSFFASTDREPSLGCSVILKSGFEFTRPFMPYELIEAEPRALPLLPIPILGLLNCTLLESDAEKSSLRPVILLNLSICFE